MSTNLYLAYEDTNKQVVKCELFQTPTTTTLNILYPTGNYERVTRYFAWLDTQPGFSAGQKLDHQNAVLRFLVKYPKAEFYGV